MRVINLLDFLNSNKDIYTLVYAKWSDELVNFLDLLSEEEQFTNKINLGIMYGDEKSPEKCIIIDGISRIISLSLLLHAICECYKKTTTQNDKAIRIIRKKYLLKNEKKVKLHLAEKDQIIYEKIIFGERLSGKEKKHPIFLLLHNFWLQIKEEKLQASNMFKMLQKIECFFVETDENSKRDLYYTLNKSKDNLEQELLIQDYLKEKGVKEEEFLKLFDIFTNKKEDFILFLRDFFVTKFNIKDFHKARAYEIFMNYYETMCNYMSIHKVLDKMIYSAQIYSNILNIQIEDTKIKNAFIQIKMHNGEDTFAYLLNIYEDFLSNAMTRATFLEILSTVDDYLKNRMKNPTEVKFNELIDYINAFIACK